LLLAVILFTFTRELWKSLMALQLPAILAMSFAHHRYQAILLVYHSTSSGQHVLQRPKSIPSYRTINYHETLTYLLEISIIVVSYSSCSVRY
ncbi:uncharacterized protein EV420DRAFT_1518630, partial [Desarmillaria tabescens]